MATSQANCASGEGYLSLEYVTLQLYFTFLLLQFICKAHQERYIAKIANYDVATAISQNIEKIFSPEFDGICINGKNLTPHMAVLVKLRPSCEQGEKALKKENAITHCPSHDQGHVLILDQKIYDEARKSQLTNQWHPLKSSNKWPLNRITLNMQFGRLPKVVFGITGALIACQS